MEKIPVRTSSRAEMVNITRGVQESIPAGFSGICIVFCLHTTAGLTINENADPDVVRDLIAELGRLVPWDDGRFSHLEGNSAAHLKATLVGASVTVPVAEGRLILGTWQGIFFCEFDGPRSRHVAIQLIPELGGQEG